MFDCIYRTGHLKQKTDLDMFVQLPRPLSQADLEKVVIKSKKTRVAARDYSGLGSQSQSEIWSVPRETPADDYQVQAAINELSKIVVSQIMNIRSDNQDN